MMDEHSRSCPEFDSLILDGCTCGLRQRRQFAEDCRLMMERMKSRSVSDVLALLADEEITLKKAQEWIGEFVLLGHRGPLTHVIPRTGYMLKVSELEALIDVYNKGEFKDADALAARFIDLTAAHQTEQTMHAAWRKRAEEAERDLAAAQRIVATYKEDYSELMTENRRVVDERDQARTELAAAQAERDKYRSSAKTINQAYLDARAEAAALRDLLTSIRCDIQCAHWHKDIDAAIDAAKESGNG